ncbi:MAG: hypothetical protein ABJE95_16580 [Byssovorax sp.]
MLSSSKIALFCLSIGLVAPACALVLGDFDPITAGGTGGLGGAGSTTNQSSAATAVGGAGGTSASASVGGAPATSGTSASSSGDSSSASTSTGGCTEDCTASAPPCKLGACVGVSCQYTNVPKDTPCTGGTCDVSGNCVATVGSGGGCTKAVDCMAQLPQCKVPTCTGGVCGSKNEMNGANASGQMTGDCVIIICDGSGNAVLTPDDDPPPPTNDCFTGSCSGTMPIQTPHMKDTPCSSGGGSYCDGTGKCVQCTNSAQCMGGMCVNNMCGPPQACIYDGVKDNGETDIDCGGPQLQCARCVKGQTCFGDSDCTPLLLCKSNVCAP